MNFQEFLNKSETVDNVTENIIVGDRFKDEDGKDFEFTIRAIKASRLEELRTSVLKNNSGRSMDTALNTKLVAECTIVPNFKSMETIDARGVHTSEECVESFLLPGEIDAISYEIGKLSGFGTGIRKLVDEAKN